MTYVPISPKLLLWACERNGKTVDEFSERFPKLSSWIEKGIKPKLKELEDFARVTHTPFGYFFLSDPPDEHLPISDFRTIEDLKIAKPSPNLIETIYAMQRRQDWLREYLIRYQAEPLEYVGSASLNDNPEHVGNEIRQRLGLEKGWSSEVKTWMDSIREFHRLIEHIGVYPVINSVVGNNTRRKLDVAEFRGFALSDSYAPLIFVNGSDAKSAQIFALAHELAHIWLNKSGLSGFKDLFPAGESYSSGSEVEKWCNIVAAELLVPKHELNKLRDSFINEHYDITKIAYGFRVSPIVLARRALDLKLLDKISFFKFYNHHKSLEAAKSSADKKGGSFYQNMNPRVGKSFAAKVMADAIEGNTSFKEAYDLIGLRGSTFQKYAEILGFNIP